jgi:hypothetical protein
MRFRIPPRRLFNVAMATKDRIQATVLVLEIIRTNDDISWCKCSVVSGSVPINILFRSCKSLFGVEMESQDVFVGCTVDIYHFRILSGHHLATCYLYTVANK